MEENKSLVENDLNTVEKSLVKETEGIAADIMKESDPKEVKRLVQLFNLNLSKKNVTRLLTFSNLMDHITDQMTTRLEKRSDEFSNADLISYLKVMQDSSEKSVKLLNQVDDTPVINLTNNTVNINTGEVSELDRESRERIMDAIGAYLERVKNDPTIYEGEIVDGEESDIEEIENSSEESNGD